MSRSVIAEDYHRPGMRLEIEVALMVMYEIRRHVLDANRSGKLAVFGLDELDKRGFAIYLGQRLKISIPNDGAFEKLETIDEVVRYVEALAEEISARRSDVSEEDACLTAGARLAEALREDSEMRSGRMR